jgi:DNA-binding IclR family transcriptional regulator
MGVTELAHRTNLLPSDVHRILNSLVSVGFIEKNSQHKTYRLGMGMMRIGLTLFQRNELRAAAHPLLQRLSEQMETTAHMALFDSRELDIFMVDQVDRSTLAPFKPRFGATTSPHCTALGKAIMANIDRATVHLLFTKMGMPKETGQTITNLAQFETELDRTYRQGYGVDLEETAKGGCCIGVAIRDWTGSAVGAISISMSADRFYRESERQLVRPVKDVAAHLSSVVGFFDPLSNPRLSLLTPGPAEPISKRAARTGRKPETAPAPPVPSGSAFRS